MAKAARANKATRLNGSPRRLELRYWASIVAKRWQRRLGLVRQSAKAQRIVLCVSLVVGLVVAGAAYRRATDLDGVDVLALEEASPYLASGHVSRRGSRVFFGELTDRWRGLSQEERQAEAESIEAWLQTQNVDRAFIRSRGAIAIDYEDDVARLAVMGKP